MKVLMIFVLFVVAVYMKRTYDSPFVYRNNWKLCKCEGSGRFIKEYLHNMTCVAKVYNRTYSAFTIIGYIKKPIYSYISGQVLYKYGTIYREVINVPRTFVCEITKIIKTNTLWRGIYEAAEIVMPNAIHECPYYDFYAANITLNDLPVISHFPHGDYKAFVYLYDSYNGESLVNLTFALSIRSIIKESFGK
ncbi:hypothetical protein PVAND_001278 [Polypedilum vanderplanki]|uniref:Uncharacterized protein n=1 Tax=Polypedilum vanderplanki TaxID=319348 RepID=A0A9J6BN05_POLVA|nr:hypothetical protein PVAND_001278 [Polypedilum vanderplanki]